MHKFVSPTAAKHTAAEEWLELLWQSHLDASTLMLVGRHDKQGDPIDIYVKIPTCESTASCSAKQMPPKIDAAFQQLLAGVSPELNAYACYVPAEALTLLKKADFQAHLKHELANQCTQLHCPCLGLSSGRWSSCNGPLMPTGNRKRGRGPPLNQGPRLHICTLTHIHLKTHQHTTLSKVYTSAQTQSTSTSALDTTAHTSPARHIRTRNSTPPNADSHEPAMHVDSDPHGVRGHSYKHGRNRQLTLLGYTLLTHLSLCWTERSCRKSWISFTLTRIYKVFVKR